MEILCEPADKRLPAMKKILLSPVTHLNLMLVGILIFIGMLHEHTHHTMKQDVHGVVKQFCRENPDTCIRYGNNDY